MNQQKKIKIIKTNEPFWSFFLSNFLFSVSRAATRAASSTFPLSVIAVVDAAAPKQKIIKI
jgi:hypothetical protein